MLNEPDMPGILAATIEKTWNLAQVLRSPLLRIRSPSDRKQSSGAYQRVKCLLDSKARHTDLSLSEGTTKWV